VTRVGALWCVRNIAPRPLYAGGDPTFGLSPHPELGTPHRLSPLDVLPPRLVRFLKFALRSRPWIS